MDNTAYLNMGLLRFTTAGSVDDGKSTLIGRMLFDSKAIFQDQLDALEFSSKRIGEEDINLALLTDGLRAEREQGITIDVAYRYFHTPKRKFIIADTPGHIQYTRNMVTGASTVNLAVILVDARNGVLEQTNRHAYIASLLKIPHIIVCINKMDLVDFRQERFEKIRTDFQKMSAKLDIKDIRFVPISAKLGDNVVDRSQNMLWYEGPTFLYLLDNIQIAQDRNFKDSRFPVQYIIRPQSDEFHDFRGYTGRVASGVFKPGDEVKVLPSGLTSKIKSINLYKEQLDKAWASQSVTISLEDDIDISRGDMIVPLDNIPNIGQDIEMMVCWFNPEPLRNKGKYVLRHTTNETRCIVRDVIHKMNINTLEKDTENKDVNLNDIVKISIKTTKPIYYDTYMKNSNTGSVILIDEATNETVAAGMIV
jgi:sulfate adenylyltransferase subunit 1